MTQFKISDYETIKNKFRYAREGTLLGGGFPLVGKALQQTYKYAAKPVIKGGLNVAGKTMGGVAKVASMDKYILPNMAKGLRYAAVKPLEKVVAPIIIGAWAKTNPLKVTSPVIATFLSTGISVIAETIDVTMAIPADGPSLGVAPSGTCIWKSFLSKTGGIIPNSKLFDLM